VAVIAKQIHNKKDAEFALKKAKERLDNLYLPKGVDLSEQSPFTVPLVDCSLCGSSASEVKSDGTFNVKCSQCDNQIQAPVKIAWKARMLWAQKNSSIIHYRFLPYFNLDGCSKSRAKKILGYTEVYIRIKRKVAQISESLWLEHQDNVFDSSYWDALHNWVILAQASVKNHKLK